MSSVTQRIREITQPRGGYINPSDFDVRELEDGRKLNEEENVHASITRMVVDYMTRFMMGAEVNESFLIEIDNGRKDKTLSVPQQTYQINSLVATLYNLSTARRGVNSIRSKMLKAIFDSEHFHEFNSVLTSYRSSLNAPFRQSPVKIKEVPDDNWPTLFDNV